MNPSGAKPNVKGNHQLRKLKFIEIYPDLIGTCRDGAT